MLTTRNLLVVLAFAMSSAVSVANTAKKVDKKAAATEQKQATEAAKTEDAAQAAKKKAPEAAEATEATKAAGEAPHAAEGDAAAKKQ